MKAETWTDTCTSMFIETSFRIAISGSNLNGWMDKQHMVYTPNRMLFSLENEGESGTCYNISEPWRHDAKWH